MYKYLFKNEDELNSSELQSLEDLLVPLFSWSYHFSQSVKNNRTLYFDSKPKWRLLFYNDNELIGSLSIVKRDITEPVPLIIGGIGNIGIKDSYQGKGLALAMLQEAHKFMKEKKINISLLFCIERLKNLYIKAGYIQMEKQVIYESNGKFEKEPLALFFPLSISSEEVANIKRNGLQIGHGSW